ncbi:MAG TPA: PKD domain-containing protein [Bacteroidales bacterium]|nr:PKD domain-containing protein [Bacteroidales bacterium]
MDLEELFRKKLESSELIPSDGTGRNIMRSLGRREFLRFNLARFNVYYTGAIVAAGAAAITLLTTLHQGNKKTQETGPGKDLNVTNTITSGAENSGIRKDMPVATNSVVEKNQGDILKKPVAATSGDISRSNTKSRSQVPAQNDVSSLISKKEQIRDKVTENVVGDVGIQKKLSAAFSASAQSGCVPFSVKFSNNSVAYDSCYWSFGDGGHSSVASPDWIFDSDGEYRVVLKVFTRDGSVATASANINVFSRPVARFEFRPDNPMIPDDEIHFINTSVDAVRCHWDFGDGNGSDAWEPVYRYEKYEKYNLGLIVWSDHNCADSMVIKNAFAGSGNYITFPNAFIPNTDGPAGSYYTQKSDEAAQIFHPVTSGILDYHLKIFSKIGILVFESNDINIGWDGYHNGQLCDPGVYIWKVRGTYKNGESFVKMGDVTLLKH